MTISEAMLKSLRDCEKHATAQADEFAGQAAKYRAAAEELERDAMQARLDAEAWQETLQRYEKPTEKTPAVETPGEPEHAQPARVCACGLPGVPGMTHHPDGCFETTLVERLVAGRPPYGDPAPTTVMPVLELEALDAGNGAL